MGNTTGSKKIESKQEPQPKEDIGPKVLQMYQDLMKMGFPDDLSLAAASKYPNNIEDAMDWLMNKETINQMLKDENIDPADKYENNQSNIKHEQQSDHNNNNNNEIPIENNQIQQYENMHEQNEYNNTDINIENDSIDNKENNESLPLELIRNNSNNISEAISTADIVIKGEFSPDTSDDSMLIIIDLMNGILNENNNKYSSNIIKPFIRWTNKIKTVKLNSMYYHEICEYLLYKNDKRVKNLYGFDMINKIFKNVEIIQVYHTGWISKFYMELLLNILENIHYLEYSKVNKICLNDINNMRFVDQNIDKYKLLFKQNNWNIENGVSNLIVTRYYG